MPLVRVCALACHLSLAKWQPILDGASQILWIRVLTGLTGVLVLLLLLFC